MAKITLGGQEYDIPVLSFKTIKRLWPLVEKFTNKDESDSEGDNPFESVDKAIEILSIAMLPGNPEMTVDSIESKLTAPEMAGLEGAIVGLLTESGLVKQGDLSPGEALPPIPEEGAKEGSTETGTA